MTGAADRAAAGLHRRCRRSTRGLLLHGWAAHRTRRPRPRPRLRRHEGARSRATRARRACCRHPSLPSVPLSAPSLSHHSTRAQDMRARWHPSVSLAAVAHGRAAPPQRKTILRLCCPRHHARPRSMPRSHAIRRRRSWSRTGEGRQRGLGARRSACARAARPGRCDGTSDRRPNGCGRTWTTPGGLRTGEPRAGHSSVGVGLRASGERGGD